MANTSFLAKPIRLGFLALTDAAPLVVAEERGLFAARDLRVELRREIGWATIRDKVIYGELEGAHAPAPLLWSAQLGIHCPACDVTTGLVMNLHGNALTLSRKLWDEGVRDDTALRRHALHRRNRNPMTFAVVFPFSSHHLLLRQWLASLQLDPAQDVRIVVVPPAQVFRNLAAGTIDGFCAGEPWNTLAHQEGIGWGRLCSAIAMPGHVEKVLMVKSAFAARRDPEHRLLLAALVEAAAWCDEARNREALAELLASPRYLNVPAAAILPTLHGRFARGPGETEAVPDFHRFHRDGANIPDPAKAAELQTELVRAGLLPASVGRDLPARLFRPDFLRQSLPTTHASVENHVLPAVLSDQPARPCPA